jgi:uncharacterized membrane protein YccC
MDYDVVSFLNNSMALVAGVACGALAYQLFLPPDPHAARRYVVHRIRRGLRSLAQREPVPPAWVWQTRMFDRVNRLYSAANPSGTPTSEWYEGGLGALNLGNELLRLRLLLEAGKLSNEVILWLQSVIASFGSIVSNPDSARSTIQAADAALQQTTPPEERDGRRTWYRALGILREMGAFFIEHPAFLSPR